MGDEIDPRRAYVLEYRRIMRRWRDANLGEAMRQKLAEDGARAAHPLTEEQQRDVDTFLNPVRLLRRWHGRAPEQERREPLPFDFEIW